MGHILHICFLDKISRGDKITVASIRLASKKYYENTISKYFDRLNRYALEPFENKLDRHNQQQLLKCIIDEARSVRKRIIEKEVGGKYFEALGGTEDFKEEVEKLNKDIMLDPVELDIVTTLNEEKRKMRAGEISVLIDTTHQMVGKRTSKLQEMGLIKKERDSEDGKMRSEITERCEETYFD